jgi:hypothetical protein
MRKTAPVKKEVMKQAMISIFILSICLSAYYTSTAQVDSSMVLRDSLYNLRANYIGQPLAKLITDLKEKVSFASPDNQSGRKTGAAYYQNIILFVNVKHSFPVRGFQIRLANKVPIDLGAMVKCEPDLWDIQLMSLLGQQVVTSISKSQ